MPADLCTTVRLIGRGSDGFNCPAHRARGFLDDRRRRRRLSSQGWCRHRQLGAETLGEILGPLLLRPPLGSRRLRGSLRSRRRFCRPLSSSRFGSSPGFLCRSLRAPLGDTALALLVPLVLALGTLLTPLVVFVASLNLTLIVLFAVFGLALLSLCRASCGFLTFPVGKFLLLVLRAPPHRVLLCALHLAALGFLPLVVSKPTFSLLPLLTSHPLHLVLGTQGWRRVRLRRRRRNRGRGSVGRWSD